MDIWVQMVLWSQLVPVIMIAFGIYFRFYGGPKRINHFFGYRTPMAKINMDTWKFAHTYIGKPLKYAGLILVPITIAAMFFVRGHDAGFIITFAMIAIGVHVAVIIVLIVFTELALRKTFDYNGMRK